ncbi:MAG: HEAT repeat domain-containing protein [Actinomycetota bacterium]
MLEAHSTFLEELLERHNYDAQALRRAVLADGPAAVEPLIDALSNQRGPLLAVAITLLVELGDRRAVVPLIEVLLRPPSNYRSPPAPFGYRVAQRVSPSLRRLERDATETEWIMARVHAAHALAQLGDPRAVGALIAIRDDPNERVRTAVRKAISQLDASNVS